MRDREKKIIIHSDFTDEKIRDPEDFPDQTRHT